jgi:acyl-ACP thioesterase
MQQSNPPLIHRHNIIIHSYDVDFRRRLRPDALCGYLQEAASEHAIRLGVGYRQLEAKGLFWVLSRLLIRIEQMPAWHETLSVETWAKGSDRLFALRDFLLRNATGEVLCRATSCWLMLDQATRRPVRPDRYFERLHHPAHAIENVPDKLAPAVSGAVRHQTTARYTDLDHNRHVNNIRYPGWISDSFTLDFYEKYWLSHMQINFLAEVKAGQAINIRLREEHQLSHLLSGFVDSTDKACFSARLEWAAAS